MSADRLLIIDTATRTPVVAIAAKNGKVLAESSWTSRHRHGEELLQRIDGVLADARIGRRSITGVVVGTGPGSFTGLRIGLATAKTIAYALGVPVVGVETTRALWFGVAEEVRSNYFATVTLPAGAVDRYVHHVRREGSEPEIVAHADIGADAIAIDLDHAPEEAKLRGRRALDALASSLAILGSGMLDEGEVDDIETLVPAYVALPRGIAKAAAEMEWSPDLR
jgi:tRNA threonylcarbamoyladenosine biosynthesis protein TsaB